MAGISLGDIAKDLNLSRVTVSMIMNGKAEKWRISNETREKVLNRAREMGYRRNANATAMITGKTRVIGYLESDIADEPSARTLHGLVKAAVADGYSVKPFVYARNGGFNEALHHLMEYRPDALVYRMCSHEDLATLRQECRNFQIPLLVHGSAYPMDWGLRVNTDDLDGARMATRHLLELGHRNIYHIGQPDQGIEYADSRCHGFIEEMTKAGISDPARKILHIQDFNIGLNHQSAQLERQLGELLRLPAKNRPTAFFCNSDPLAMKAIRIIRQAGLRIPEDISIVGFADLEMAKYADPPLTTVAEPFAEVGVTIFDLLKNELTNPDMPSMQTEIAQYVKERLIIRESTQRRTHR